MPPKKKIRLGINQTRIFENGEVIAVLLRTAGKNYSMNYEKLMSEEEYHALDGKYVLMQLIDCPSNQQSPIVPKIKDCRAIFRLFNVNYDLFRKK